MSMPIMAKRIFIAGHANEVMSSPLIGFLKYIGLKGTGFAHQKCIKKIMRNHIGSICFNGFGVNLPASLAVGSPSL